MFRRRQRNKKVKDGSPDIAKSSDSLDKVLDGDASPASSDSLYRSRSVSMDAYRFRSNSNSEMKGLPSAVRKSLVALDKVLEDFEDDSKKTSRRHSVPLMRNLFEKFGLKKNKDRNLPSDARKSVEALDKVLNEYDDVIIVALKKRRSSSASNLTTKCNEDVRRSLEILDNVLAEFDDHDAFSSSDSILVNGDEQESRLSHAHQEKERWQDENGNSLQKSNLSSYQSSPNGHVSPYYQSLESSADGSTSQYTSLLDESRRCSAPPVPKRSPGTRLSHRDRHFFPEGEEDDETSQDNASCHSLSSLHLPNQNGDRSHGTIAEGKRKAALSVPTPGSSSPVHDNAQISNRLRQAAKITCEDPCLEFYLVRNGDDENEADDDVFVSPPRRDVNSKTAICQVCGGNLDHTSVTARSRGTRRFPMDPAPLSPHAEAHLRRMRLDKKFAKVKVLLKSNQITGLDKPPPTFKPPPPPQARISEKPPRPGESSRGVVVVEAANTSPTPGKTAKSPNEASIQKRPRGGSAKETRVSSDVEKPTRPSKEASCVKCERENLNVISDHPSEPNYGKEALTESGYLDKAPDNQSLLPTDVLCKNCINKGWTFRTTDFVTGSPNSLKRPPLGLSYSMEDDLSPGIKEISGSSPKDSQNDSLLSSPKSSPAAHMSTFSHSASSLGDGSSQSELDFSNSLDSGKVPLSSIKSRTLPTDMKLGPSPFYSPMEGERVNGTDKKLSVSELEAVRSSSAPPPPQDKGHWKKDKTGFSRKEKQTKDDADSSRQTEEEEVTAEAKPKKRSVWKSILRRK